MTETYRIIDDEETYRIVDKAETNVDGYIGLDEGGIFMDFETEVPISYDTVADCKLRCRLSPKQARSLAMELSELADRMEGRP